MLRFGADTARTTMKLHILSDLHTEFAAFAPPETDADAVILAGDIDGAMDRLYDDVLAFEASLGVFWT
jgi:hypothetical protein